MQEKVLILPYRAGLARPAVNIKPRGCYNVLICVPSIVTDFLAVKGFGGHPLDGTGAGNEPPAGAQRMLSKEGV